MKRKYFLSKKRLLEILITLIADSVYRENYDDVVKYIEKQYSLNFQCHIWKMDDLIAVLPKYPDMLIVDKRTVIKATTNDIDGKMTNITINRFPSDEVNKMIASFNNLLNNETRGLDEIPESLCNQTNLALGSGIMTRPVIYSLFNLWSKKKTDLIHLLDTSSEGYSRYAKCMSALLAKVYSIQENPTTPEERAVYKQDFASNAAEFEQVGIRLSELESHDIYNSDERTTCLKTLHPALPNVIKQASAIETQSDAILALREFDNITRPLKNILMLTSRHSDAELHRRHRKKLI